MNTSVTKTGETIKADSTEHLAAALREAKAQGKPFVIPWRQSDEADRRWQDEAGCQCGTSE
jgi:hypothetical protein